MLPELNKAKEETAEKIIVVNTKKVEVGEKTEEVQKEETAAKEILSKAENMKKEADFEVSRVMPIYNLAIRAVSQLKPNDITEIRGFKTATPPVEVVMNSLIILF